ncbi:MAG: transposase [Planctomycetota bacterium]|nr:transposase [Planctomycetota bacterium]
MAPEIFQGVQERIKHFVQSFTDLPARSAQREHILDCVLGLVSDLERKNIESIAYRLDPYRLNLQHFTGSAEWNHRPLFAELAGLVDREPGEVDAVIVFDPSMFGKQGKKSAGVACQ